MLIEIRVSCPKV